MHPLYVQPHVTLAQLALPFVPLLLPLTLRFAQGAVRYAHLRQEAA